MHSLLFNPIHLVVNKICLTQNQVEADVVAQVKTADHYFAIESLKAVQDQTVHSTHLLNPHQVNQFL